jgi:hypothetical protein
VGIRCTNDWATVEKRGVPGAKIVLEQLWWSLIQEGIECTWQSRLTQDQ